MTPSNANTSGLDCVRIIACHLPEARCPDTVCLPITITAGDLRAVYAVLVTAASAQARIAELETLVASIRKAQRDVIRAEIEQEGYSPISDANDRATAAEARADRLAASTADIVLALRGLIVSLPDDLCENSDAFTELTEALERAPYSRRGDVASLLLIAMGYGFIVWRAHLYLKGKPLGRRAQLSMSVRNGRVHFRSTPHELP